MPATVMISPLMIPTATDVWTTLGISFFLPWPIRVAMTTFVPRERPVRRFMIRAIIAVFAPTAPRAPSSAKRLPLQHLRN